VKYRIIPLSVGKGAPPAYAREGGKGCQIGSPAMQLLLLFLFLLTSLCYAANTNITYDFKNPDQNNRITFTHSHPRLPPKIEEGYIELINGGYTNHLNNAIYFPDIISGTAQNEHYTFELCITPGANGAGFALINTRHFTADSLTVAVSSWEEPNIAKSFALGIDIYNPQTSAWFDEYGNYYGRPQREISLHWDGKEQFKVLSPVEFRAEEDELKAHLFQIDLQYITAGASVSVSIDSTVIIDQHFIPEMVQYTKRPVFGATTGELTTSVYLAGFEVQTTGTAPQFQKLHTATLVKDEGFHAERREMHGSVSFPKAISRANVAILTLDLGGLAGGVSDWDVTGAINLTAENCEQYEIIRYITPYHRGYVWKVDVSHFLPLFWGTVQILARVETWEEVTENPADQKGWLVNATIDFYTGKVEKTPLSVVNLWNGSFEYGNPEMPMQNYLPEKEVKVPKGATSAKLRMVVTGHGMSPNSENAAEFRPSQRVIAVNGTEYSNLLWKTDNYLNPCRPQGGTWKFDRAGWAPGDIVRAWEIDLDEHLTGNNTLNISYTPDDYINERKGETWDPFHKFGSQIIFYK